MAGDEAPEDPGRVEDLADLARELKRLRRLAARKGQVQLSVRDVASRIGRAPSTIDPYLRGQRLCPADIYEDMLRALGVPTARLRPWIEAWERVADAQRVPSGAGGRPQSETLTYCETFIYAVLGDRSPCRVGIVTGDIRRIRLAEVWVNSENTEMRMARFEENSISAIVRFGGARHDDAGRVIADVIADELEEKVRGRRPVAPATALPTGAGGLATTNGVRFVIHVATVHGEPGDGYRQVFDIGRCVTNTLAVAESLGPPGPPIQTVLFPLLGTGVAGGHLSSTIVAMLGAVLDHLANGQSQLRAIYFLATRQAELDACRAAFDDHPRLAPRSEGSDR